MISQTNENTKIYLIHGEEEAKIGLQNILKSKGKSFCEIPVRSETIEV